MAASLISQTISSLGTVPTTADPDNFDTNADAFLGTALPNMRTEYNTFATEANAMATQANTDASSAATNASTLASAADTAAGYANLEGNWSSLTGALNKPASVYHSGTFWALLNNLADVTASEPGVDADWAALNPHGRISRTSNTIIAVANKGKEIVVTSGTFTQTWDALANFGEDFYVIYRNAGTGVITHDFDGSETCDGVTTITMYPGEARYFAVTPGGATWYSYVIAPFSYTFTGSGNFLKPPGYNYFGGLAWSAGGSGQRTNNTGTTSRGGPGGGCFPFTFPASAFSASETFTIGAGGSAVTTVADGNSGGNTTIGSLLTVYGGAASATTNGGAIGPNGSSALTSTSPVGFEGASSGAAAVGRNAVWGGSTAHTDAGGDSGNSIYGGAAGGGVNGSGTLRTAGTSVFGGDGGAAAVSSNGTAGTQPGGGGGATQTGTQSGAGADGQVTIWGIA